MNSKIEALKQLKQQCMNCTQCPIYGGDGRVSNPKVFGVGNVNTTVVVVGQGPGYYETVERKPFVGAAGRNFDKLLTEFGLVRKLLYITNTIKCYCPGNRGPYPDEVANCKPFLQQELAIIQPQLIIALGNYALQYFTGHRGISKCHGQVEYSEEFGVDVIPVYHPSPLNMNKEAKRQAARKDFKSVLQHKAVQQLIRKGVTHEG
jgi:DNA polymerase